MPTDYAIKDGRTVFDATTYTGDGTSSKAVTNAVGFKPDFVWGKRRDAAGNNNLYDSIRGVTNYLTSNGTGAEIAGVSGVSAFNTNGFSVGSHPDMNTSGGTFVGWQWQAGQGTTSSNTNGSITSTVSVNATAGFSIVTYNGNGTSGATVGHGLGVAPKMIILKIRNTSYSWAVYHESIGNTKYLQLNDTIAATTDSAYWNNTSPTSSVFSLGNKLDTNAGFGNYVAYCWAEVAGFSKFGSYTGNGSTDGPFVYTGFRPKFVMVKRTDGIASWMMYDTVRNPKNVVDQVLYAQLSNAEGTSDQIDIVSNGFKMRTTGASFNASGGSYIYMCFAENPFKYANAR